MISDLHRSWPWRILHLLRFANSLGACWGFRGCTKRPDWIVWRNGWSFAHSYIQISWSESCTTAQFWTWELSQCTTLGWMPDQSITAAPFSSPNLCSRSKFCGPLCYLHTLPISTVSWSHFGRSKSRFCLGSWSECIRLATPKLGQMMSSFRGFAPISFARTWL